MSPRSSPEQTVSSRGGLSVHGFMWLVFVAAWAYNILYFVWKVNKLAVSEAERKDQEESKQDQPIVFGMHEWQSSIFS